MTQVNYAKEVIERGPHAKKQLTYSDYRQSLEDKIYGRLQTYKHRVVRQAFRPSEDKEMEAIRLRAQQKIILNTLKDIDSEINQKIQNVRTKVISKVIQGKKHIPILVNSRKKHKRWIKLTAALVTAIATGIYIFNRKKGVYIKKQITWRKT